MSNDAKTRVSDETRAEEAKEAQKSHKPDLPQDPSVERSAPDHVDERVSEHARDMARRGAEQKGEGRIP